MFVLNLEKKFQINLLMPKMSKLMILLKTKLMKGTKKKCYILKLEEGPLFGLRTI